MKPRFLAFPFHFIVTSSAVVAVLAPLNTLAIDFTWGGVTSSDWTLPANWTTGTAPTYGTTYASDTLRISNGAGAGAVYDPGSALTTTFSAGRAFILGSTTAGSLTVSSGTLAAARGTNFGSEPIMANNANASLLINGGALDLSGHLNTFLFLNSGTANTSNLTISSGSFASNGFNFQTAGTGAGTINLEGGFMAVNAFVRQTTASPITPTTTGSTTFNLDGGTLRARINSTSFLPALTGLQTIVEDGGAVIDTNGFNVTIAEVLEHDATLGVTADGGLTKNGAGTLSLTGTNTFTGPVTVNAGTALATSRLLLANNSSAGTGAVTLADSYTELQVNNTRDIANAVTVSNTGDEKALLLPSPGGGAFAGAAFSGAITINETNIDHFRIRADDNCFLTLSGNVSGPGGIYKFFNGVVTLSNPANDFTGGVKITQGTISFFTGGLGSSGSILMDGGGLRWNPTNDEDVSSRIVLVNGKTATFNLMEGGDPYDISNVSFANAIGSGTSAALVKTGPGTLTLTQPSSYSGGTTVSQGTLEFANDGLGTSGSITMNGGILRWATSNTQDLSSRVVMVNAKSASFSTNGNDVNFAGAIGNSSTGNLGKTNTLGTLTLNGTNTYTGTTTVGGGTLKLAAGATITASASLTLGAPGTLDTSAQTTYSVPAAQPIAFGINAGGSGSAGKIAAAGLDVSNATVTYTITGTPDDPVYVLATYTGTLAGTFLSVPAAPTGYTLKYDHEGNKIALVQDAASGFAAWQSANSTAGGLGDDHDNDGVDNGTEYFLAGNADSTGFTALPGVINTAGVLSVTWTKAATGYAGTYNSGFVVETSDTLAAASWVTAAEGAGADQVSVTGNEVKYTFPAGTKNFVRLKVTAP
jgi:autotransporter-associated beta strand protein